MSMTFGRHTCETQIDSTPTNANCRETETRYDNSSRQYKGDGKEVEEIDEPVCEIELLQLMAVCHAYAVS